MPIIGILTYGLDRALGGIGRYTEELLWELFACNLDPLLLQAGPTSAHKGVQLKGSRLLPGLMTIGQVQLAWLAARHRLQLVHDPIGVMPLSLANARRITTVHDVIPYIYANSSTTLDWLIYRLWLPIAAHRTDTIITDSEQSKEDIVKHLSMNANKVKVIPLAASEQYRPLQPQAVQPVLAQHQITTPYILYVGSIAARKNLPRLLEAYANLRKWSTKWTLVIVGARKWKSSPVYETVERLDLAQHVHFTGFVEEEDLPALYNGADLFVFPSLYEGFGLPPLEAMACGTPVVTSNTSSLPEVVGDAAILVDPYNVEEITAAMRSVLEDPDLAQDLRQCGLTQAAKFSWERTARETIAVYEQVLGQKLT